MATSEASAIWAQKSRDFHGPPIPRVMDLPPSKSLSQSAILKTGTLVILGTQVLLQVYSVFCILCSVLYVVSFM
jgi:hypothetical protein